MHPLLEPGRTLAPGEFEAFVGDREEAGDINHYELLNGRIVVTPPAGWPHGSHEATLVRQIGNHVEEGGLGRVFGSSQGYVFPTGDIVEPDVAFVSTARWRAAPAPEEGKFLRLVPDLLVEILSKKTRSRDLGEKKGIYERNGVGEYWLVDSRRRRVIRLVLRDGRFDLGTTFDAGTVFESEVLAGLSIDLAALFAD